MLNGESRLWGVVFGAVGLALVMVAVKLVVVAREGSAAEAPPDGGILAEVTDDPKASSDAAPPAPPALTAEPPLPIADVDAGAEPDPDPDPTTDAPGALPSIKTTKAKKRKSKLPHRR